MERVGGVAVALAIASLLVASGASAQDAQTEARMRFQRGLEHFEDERYGAALIEFRRAYELAPSYRLLYNIGNVHAAQREAVEAVDAWEQYLTDGGENIGAARRAEIERSLEAQRQNIGLVHVQTNVQTGSVTIDGAHVAPLPLSEPIRLSIGRYTVGVEAPGWSGPARRIEVAGLSNQTVEIELVEVERRQGTIRIRSHVSGVEVRVDGEVIGETPFTETVALPVGEHVITGRRAGYLEGRTTVEVEDAAEDQVRLDMRIDPDAMADDLGRLSLSLPSASHRVEVDGAEVDVSDGVIELPVGEHDILVEVESRQPHSEQILLAARETLELEPALEWTPTARDIRRDSAERRRFIGALVGIAGVVAVGAGAAVFLWNEGRADRMNELESIHDCVFPPPDAPAGVECDVVAANMGFDEPASLLAGEYQSLDSAIPLFRVGSIIGMVAGAAAAAFGGWLWFGAASDDEVDAEARAGAALMLIPGPGSISAAGSF